MTPLPANTVIVLHIAPNGAVIDNRNNIGNDLRIVVTRDEPTFDEEAAGIPYTGKTE